MCAPLCSRVSPDPHTHSCHPSSILCRWPAPIWPVGRIRACISASMRAVIILQPHPPHVPPRSASAARTRTFPNATVDAAAVPPVWEMVSNLGHLLLLTLLAVQHSKISRYMSEGSPLSEEEWESCLTSLLLGTQPIANFHVAAQFTDENLGIEIGNRVSGATVRCHLPLGPCLTHDPGPHQTFENGPQLTRGLSPEDRRHSRSETQQVWHQECRYVRLGQ